MPDVVTATEAKVHFGELMRRVVERREPVYVERGGRPQVVVLAVADYERLLSCEVGGGWLARAHQARDRIQAVTEIPQIGRIYTGKVVRIESFGAFVEILPNQDGMVHISQLDSERVERVEQDTFRIQANQGESE